MIGKIFRARRTCKKCGRWMKYYPTGPFGDYYKCGRCGYSEKA